MLDSDIKILDAQDDITLAKWWVAINHSETPKELDTGEEMHVKIDKPMIKWTKKDKNDFFNSRSIKIMHYIDEKVGHKLCLKVGNPNMSEEEFNDFWNGHYEGDTEARHRDKIRGYKKIASEDGLDIDSINWDVEENQIVSQIERLRNDS